MKENKLYNYAYQHLQHRIRCGFYPKNSRLPAVPMLCMEFHVSSFTIHCAFKMLEKENLISISQGRNAIVTYDARRETCEAYFLSICHAMKEAVFSLQATLIAVWPGILLQGLRLCDEQDLEKLTAIADTLAMQESQTLHVFFGTIVDKIGNSLISNFHRSANLFMHEINCSKEEIFLAYFAYLRKKTQEILLLRKEENYSELKTLLEHICREQGRNIEKFYAELAPAVKEIEPIPYCWDNYWGKPQVSFQFAMELLRKIYYSYKKYEYIPSVSQLSKQYSVPAMSVRRGIAILNDIGITETINGKGTRVIVGDETPIKISSLSSPNLKKAMIPYLSSVQFILITCREAVRAVFPTATEEVLLDVSGRLREIYDSGDFYMVFGVCLDFLTEGSPCQSFQELYGNLKHLQYMGYPLNDLKPNEYRYDDRCIKVLLASLENRDSESFAEEMERLALDIFLAGKEKLLAGGVQEVENLVTPYLWEMPV